MNLPVIRIFLSSEVVHVDAHDGLACNIKRDLGKTVHA